VRDPSGLVLDIGILITCQGVMMGLATCRGRPAVAKSLFGKGFLKSISVTPLLGYAQPTIIDFRTCFWAPCLSLANHSTAESRPEMWGYGD